MALANATTCWVRLSRAWPAYTQQHIAVQLATTRPAGLGASPGNNEILTPKPKVFRTARSEKATGQSTKRQDKHSEQAKKGPRHLHRARHYTLGFEGPHFTDPHQKERGRRRARRHLAVASASISSREG
eukprot:scaffold140185_cov145-Phaeocystis_antarctica.AAC.1